MLFFLVQEFLLFAEENRFVSYSNSFKKECGNICILIKMKTASLLDISCYTKSEPTYYYYFTLLMCMNGKLESNGMKFSTLQKIVDNLDIISSEAQKISDYRNFCFKNSVKYIGKTPLSINLDPYKIFLFDNLSNEIIMSVDLEDGLLFSSKMLSS